MEQQRIVLSRSPSLGWVVYKTLFKIKLSPYRLPGFRPFSKTTYDGHCISGFELIRSSPRVVFILPGLFADSRATYARWVAELLAKSTPYSVVLLDGFASEIANARQPFPLGLGSTEALALSPLFDSFKSCDRILIGYSYGGAVSLFLNNLCELTHTLLVNPFVNSERAIIHIDHMKGRPGEYFRAERQKLARLFGTDPRDSFFHLASQVLEPRQRAFLRKFKPEWAEFSRNPIDHLQSVANKSISLITSDTDPVVLKTENGDLLVQQHTGRGTFYDVSEGYHTQHFETHPDWFGKTVLHEITRF